MKITPIDRTNNIKSLDTGTPVKLQILDTKDNLIDLTAYTDVKVIIGNGGGRLREITPSSTNEKGELHFKFSEGNTLPHGKYVLEVEMTSGTETVIAPSSGFFEMNITRSLNEVGEVINTISFNSFITEVKEETNDYTNKQTKNTETITKSVLGQQQQKEVVSIFDDSSEWSVALGTKSVDTTNFRSGLQGIKLSHSGTAWLEADLNDVNFYDYDFQIDFYVHDISTLVDGLEVLLDTSGNWSGFFAAGFQQYELKQGWNSIGANPLTFNDLGSNNPSYEDLKAVKQIRLKISPDVTSAITFDRILAVEKPLSKGKVTLSFDDGHNTVFDEAKWRMDKYNFRGVAYVITDHHDGTRSNRMTLEQLKTLDALGWDVASHTKNHTLLVSDNPTPELITEELLSSKQWLIKNGFYRGSQHLATPGGQFNDPILEEIKQYYSTHRTVIENHEQFPPINPYVLRIRNVISSTSVATVQSWIDQAEEKNEWLILLFHYFMSPADTETKVLPEDFGSMMDYLSTKNVDVVTMSDMIQSNGVQFDSEKGIVLNDKTTGSNYRLNVNNGVLGIEPI